MKFFPSFPSQSLALRLLFSSVVISFAFVAGTAIIFSLIYYTQTLANLDDELGEQILTLVTAVEMDEAGEILIDELKLPGDEAFQIPLSGQYWLIARLQDTGRLTAPLFNSASLWDGEIVFPDRVLAELITDPGRTITLNGTGPRDERVHLVAKSILLQEDAAPLIFIAAKDRSQLDFRTGGFIWIVISSMTMFIIVGLLALWLGIHKALQPLARMRQDIEAIRVGKITKMADDYPDEVLPLSQEVNKLLEHNRGIVERAETHVGNLAHALKTPLAVITNEAKGQTELDHIVRKQARSMHGHIQYYLKRARAAARAQIIGTKTEIAPVINDLSRLFTKLFMEKGIGITADCPMGLYCRGEKQDLEDMLGNLMENACKWAASKVHVHVEADKETICIYVDDDGKGLTAKGRAQALKRGVRLDQTEPGTGLGLSIVAELADIHTGSIMLERAPRLGGLRAKLVLPRA